MYLQYEHILPSKRIHCVVVNVLSQKMEAPESIQELESFKDHLSDMKHVEGSIRTNSVIRPLAMKSRARPSSHHVTSEGESFTLEAVDCARDVLKSIHKNLERLEMLQTIQQSIAELTASLEFSQKEIDKLKKENTSLKGTVHTVRNAVETIHLENRMLKEFTA